MNASLSRDPSASTVPMRLLSVNTAAAGRIDVGGRRVMSAITKRPVTGAVPVGKLGLHGDEQADPTVHGGLDKAVYAYPSEHYPFWDQARREAAAGQASLVDEALPFGFLGENLTLSGLFETDVWVGDRLVFPDCELVVSEPRQPCFKFVAVMGFKQAAKAMTRAENCGFYLRVVRPGTVTAGQGFTCVAGARELRIDLAFRRKMSRREE
jgi:MOSC domain-containing protein YiiM